MAVAHAEESTVHAVFPVAEAIRYCMLDTAGYVNRSRATVFADRAAFQHFVDDFNANLSHLQSVIAGGTDPSALASARNVEFVDFDNAVLSTSPRDSDPAAQVRSCAQTIG